jgi:hypothetical protein
MNLAFLLVNLAFGAEFPGRVLERGTGDPIPGAKVLVVEAPDSAILSGEDGRFVLTHAEPPRRLRVECTGFETLEVDVTDPSSLRLFLIPLPGPVEIVIEARRDSPNVSHQILDRERVEKTPGTFDDPLRLVQALPGVAATPEYSPSAGVLAIRGAAPSESRVFVDGVEIPYLYHFQQYGSVIHSRLLEEVALYPSAFSSSWGDTVGGIAAISTRRPDPVRVHAGVNLNAITAGTFVQTPMGQKSAFSASARRSFADLRESSNDQYTVWPAFWDYLTRVDIGRGTDRLGIMLLGAGDSYGRYVGDTAALDPIERESVPDFRFQRSFHGLVLHHLHQPVSGTNTETSLGVIYDRLQGSFPEAEQDRRELSVVLREVARLRLSSQWTLGFGGDVRAARVDRQAETDRPWVELAGEAPLLARGVDVDSQETSLVGGIWVEPRAQLGRFLLQPGLRLQGDNTTETLSPEPRLAMNLQTAEGQRLRLGGGRYSQAPPVDLLSPQGGNPELERARSWQGVLGYDLAIAGRWELGTDLWARSFEGVWDERIGEMPLSEDGYAAGVEFNSRYRLRERFFTWASLTLGRSYRSDHPGDWDQPWAVNLVASWDFRPAWNVGLRYRASAGLPYTPVVDGLYDGNTDTYSPVFGATNGARLPTYQKLDLHLERRFAFNSWSLVTYGEMWWVPPGSNAMYRVWSYDWSESALVAGPGLVPLVGLRAEL